MLTHGERDPSIIDAFGRVVDAGERVLVNRFDLARRDVTRIASRTLRSAAVLLLGAAVLATAWVTLTASLVLVLRDYTTMTLPGSLTLVGTGHALAGAVLFAIGMKGAAEPAEDRTPVDRVARPHDVERGGARRAGEVA